MDRSITTGCCLSAATRWGTGNVQSRWGRGAGRTNKPATPDRILRLLRYGRFVLNPAFITPAFRRGTRCARISIAVLCLAAVRASGARNVRARQPAVSGETPGTGERVQCTEEATSSNEIELNRKGIEKDTEIADRGLKGNGSRHFPAGSGKASLRFLDDFNRMTRVFSGT